MLTNYLKVAIRSLSRQKAYSVVNIVGLAVGIAATILILSYVRFEMSYDDFQRNASCLYRVSVVTSKEGTVLFDGPEFLEPAAPTLLSEFPEIENFVRISDFGEGTFSTRDRTLRIPHMMYADSSFFDLFSFQLLSGDPKMALAEPYSVVLTDDAAVGLFGTTDVIGKTVRIDNRDTYRVSGVARSAPANSHIQFGALLSFSTLYKDPSINQLLGWNGGNRYTAYIKLRAEATSPYLESRFADFIWSHLDKQFASAGLKHQLYLQSFPKIHLFYEPDSSATRTSIRIFAIVAFFVLFIACVNFVNLTTARVARRSREVGIRKVLGANRPMLIRQYLGESLMITLLAALVAIALVELFFPLFKNLVGQNLDRWSFFEPASILALIGVILIVGVGAGCYPAFFLSSLQPVNTLKGTASGAGGKGLLRGLLIVMQFSISIALIVCTFVIGSQLQFLRNKDLGFRRENILVLPLIGDEAQLKCGLIKQELLRTSGVVSACASSDVPYAGFTSNGYFPEGEQTVRMIHVVDIDEDFTKTFGIDVVQGRNFSKEFPTDKSAYLINQTMARTLGWDQPLGKRIMRNGWHTVVGVVRDFNFAKLNSPIEPLILTQEPWGGRYDEISLGLLSGNITRTLDEVRAVWNKIVPSTPFQFSFLDEDFDRLYRSEQRFEQVFLSFASLAILIALLGLLSLASLATELRTKEIGIRKVLGASSMGITGLLSGDFLRWVALANVLAWPTAYYFMARWLENFAYRVELSWWPFVASGVLSVVLGWITVSFQTIRAASANPVEALRYE